MRIIGGRDYYDGAGYGIDSSTTFVRKAILAPLDATPLHYSSREAGKYYLYRFDVVVAGECYCGLRIGKSSSYFEPIRPPRYIYDQDEATDFSHNLPQFMRDWCDLSVSDARRKTIREWSLDNKVTTAISAAEQCNVSEYNRRGFTLFDHWTRKYAVLINSDCLKEVDFFKALPPAVAHQNIASWVGGVLGFKTNTTELSNRSKIQKAGFDLVTSFRKQKSAR